MRSCTYAHELRGDQGEGTPSRPGATKSYAEWLADLNAQYGMDRGVVGGYFIWIGNAVRGNWGDSWAWTIPVTQVFKNTVWYSFALSMVSYVFEILIAIPLGITVAKKQYSFADYFTTVFSMICISMPTFFPGNPAQIRLLCETRLV